MVRYAMLWLFAVTAQAAPEDWARYSRALRSGRKLEQKKDLQGAAAAFVEALAARPNDGVVQSELGWVRFQQGDLDGCEKLTQKAIAALKDARLLGAAWYNLGRVYEARDNRAGAVTAYRTSYEKRPNRVVRERLATLDPAAAAAADPATPKLLDGPFASFEAACGKLSQSGCESEQEITAPPWKVARLVLHGDDQDLALVVQTATGWFVSPDLASCSYDQLHQRCKITELKAVNLVGGPAPELRAQVTESFEYRMDVEDLHPMVNDDQDLLMACGIGPSGKPSCTTLTVGVRAEGGGSLPKGAFALEAVFSGDQLELKSKTGKVSSDFRDALGVHKLIFP